MRDYIVYGLLFVLAVGTGYWCIQPKFHPGDCVVNDDIEPWEPIQYIDLIKEVGHNHYLVMVYSSDGRYVMDDTRPFKYYDGSFDGSRHKVKCPGKEY